MVATRAAGSTTAGGRGDSHRINDNLGPGEQGQRHGASIAIHGSNNITGSNDRDVDVAALAISEEPAPAPQGIDIRPNECAPSGECLPTNNGAVSDRRIAWPFPSPSGPPPPHYTESALCRHADYAAELVAAFTTWHGDDDNDVNNPIP